MADSIVGKFIPDSAEPIKSRRRKRRKAMSRTFKFFLILLAVVIIAVSAYAFAAANTVPTSKAGEGSGTVSGYTVSDIHYDLDATDPTTLDDVTFTLDSAATTVEAKLVSSGGTWYDCTNSSGNSWTCTTTGLTVNSVDNLDVVATSG